MPRRSSVVGGVGITLGLLVGLSLLGDARPAQAQTKRVAVLSVKGAGYKRVRRWLESQIRERWKLVAREALVDAARELGIRRRWTRKSNLQRIARKAHVDALITSYVYRRRRRWWLAVRVHDGATGRITKGGVVRYRYFRLNRWSKKAILKVIRSGVSRVEGVSHPRPRVRRPPPPRPDIPDKPDEPDKPDTGDRPPWLTAIHGGVGLALWGRRLTFANLEGEPGRQPLYETNSPVVPLAFYVEVFPGAFVSRHRALANVGLGFSFQRAVGVVSYRESDNEQIATTIQRIGGYLMYRWNINRSATSPVLRIALGVDALQFSFGQDLGLVAGVQYLSVKPELRARFPLGTERVSLGAQLAGLGTLSFGQLANAYHYGTAKGGGVQVGLEVDVRVFWKVHLRAGFTTTWMFISFSQLGEQHTDYEYVADSARDGYYGGYLLAAIHY